MSQDASAYGRGHLQGEIAARLAQHDVHFADINGSIARLVTEMHAQNELLRDVITASKLRDEKTLATALALRETDEARRAAEAKRWQSSQRIFALFASAAAIATIGTFILVLVTRLGK